MYAWTRATASKLGQPTKRPEMPRASNTEARRFLKENAISVNGQKVQRETFEASDFHNGRLMLRRGKAFKDSALVELG